MFDRFIQETAYPCLAYGENLNLNKENNYLYPLPFLGALVFYNIKIRQKMINVYQNSTKTKLFFNSDCFCIHNQSLPLELCTFKI